MNKIFRTTLIMGSSQICVIAIQIVRAKIVALIIGPAGVGVLGNTFVFLSLIENLCFLGIHIALLRYASEEISEKKYKETSQLLSTAFFIHILISSLGIVVVLLFLQKINISIYQNLNFLFVSIFALLAAPFVILYSDLANIFNAFNEIKILGKLNVFPAVIGLTSVVPLIIIFGVKGAIISIFVESVLMFLVGFRFYKHYLAGKIKIKKRFFSKKLALKMFKYGGVNQLAIIINTLAAYFLRVFVTSKLSLSGVGVFNAAAGIGSYLLTLQSPIGIYLYPKISSIYKDKQETGVEINNILRFFLIILTPLIIGILIFSDILIRVLLSREFLAVKTILLWILLVNFFQILQSIINTPLFIMEKFKIYLGVNTIFNLTLISLSYIFLYKFDLVGMTIAMSIAYGLSFIFWLIASAMVFRFRVKKENYLLLCTALALAFLTNWSKKLSLLIQLLVISITLLWLLVVVKKTEWIALNNYLKKYWPFQQKI